MSIVVIGAHGGIGEALVKVLSDKGEKVFSLSRDTSNGGVPIDVMDSEKVAGALSQIDQSEGVKGLAYCVGSIPLKPFDQATDADFIDAFQLNVVGALRALRGLEEGLKKGKGSVVLFSTLAVSQGFPNH